MKKLWNIYIYVGQTNFVRHSSFGLLLSLSSSVLYSNELFLWKVRLGSAVKTCSYHVVHWTLNIYTPIHIYNQLKSLLQHLLVIKYYQWDFQKELWFPELIYDQNQWTNLKLDCNTILVEIVSCVPCYTWSGCDIYNFAKMSENK